MTVFSVLIYRAPLNGGEVRVRGQGSTWRLAKQVCSSAAHKRSATTSITRNGRGLRQRVAVAKPAGLLGGRLNIRSISSKTQQILHSNLDHLCRSENNIDSYNMYRRGREGGGVIITIKTASSAIQWLSAHELEYRGLNIILSHFQTL